MAAGSEALNAARKALQVAAKPNSSAEDRRSFILSLLALPKDPSLEAKTFFVTLLPKYFAESGELQEEQIDGLLDICEHEDEQVRIIGIKGLATVSKADHNWAKSNTNVLLQLLESPLSELKVVKQTLLQLLSFAPSETLSAVLADMLASEGATGVPRLNILKFLLNDAEEWRRDALHSGRNPALEQDFFDDLVGIVSEIPLRETRIVIDMLSDLSIISGKSCDPKRISRFVRALTTSLEPDSSINSSMAHINTFARVARKAQVDGRSALFFLASHGGAVVELALAKDDEVAQRVLEDLYGWVKDAEKDWRSEKDPDEKKVVKGCVDSILGEVLRCVRDIRPKELDKQAGLLERIMWPIYLLVAERSRLDLLRSSFDSKLKDLDGLANSAYKDEGKQTIQGRKFRNIRDIADYLSDDKAPRLDSKPTWLEAPSTSTARPPAPAGVPSRTPSHSMPTSRHQPSVPAASPYARPAIPRQPVPAARPQAASAPARTAHPVAAAPSRSTPHRPTPPRTAPTGPSRSASSGRARSPSPPRRDPRDSRVTPRPCEDDHRDSRSGSSQRARDPSPVRSNGRDLQSRLAPARPKTRSPSPVPHDRPRAALPEPEQRPSTGTRRADLDRSGNTRGDPLSRSILGRSGSSRGVELLGPTSNAGENEDQTGSSRGKELLQTKPSESPAAATSSTPHVSRAGSSNAVSSPPASLSIRNFAAANAQTKRTREEEPDAPAAVPTPVKSAPASLLSRLSRTPVAEISRADDGRDAKRSRPSPDGVPSAGPATGETKGRASLLSRMSSSMSIRSAPSSSPSPAPPTAAVSGASPLTIRARAAAPGLPIKPASTAFSVLGRSSAASSPKTEEVPETKSVVVKSARELLPIGARTDDTPVRRKGRGFAGEELVDISIPRAAETPRIPAWNPAPSPKLAVQPQGPGKSLQARLNGGSAPESVQPSRSLAQRMGL